MKKIAEIIAALALLLIVFGLCASAETTTIMMYMCGSTIKEDCVTDIEEICAAMPSSDVNIVVTAGGTKKWKDKRLNDGVLNRFAISGGKMSAVENLGKKNMGSASTLTDFVVYARKNYPADRSILILWDHGGGSCFGICYDEVFNDDTLTLSEIAASLADVRKTLPAFKLDILGMDACMMATYEAAASVCSYADFMVASEELEPWLGWNYTPWISAIAQDPSISTEKICISIVDSFMSAALADNPNDYVSLSAIDLRKIPALVEKMELFVQKLIDALKIDYSTFSRLRQRMYSYGSFEDASYDMVDMATFIEAYSQFAPSEAESVSAALKEAVLYASKSEILPASSGLSVLMPVETASEIREYIKDISNGSIPNQVSFVEYYAKGQNGNYSFSSNDTSRPDLLSGGINDAFSSYGFVPGGSSSSNAYWIAGSAGSYCGGVCNYDWIAGSAGNSGSNNSVGNTDLSWIAGSTGGQNTPSQSGSSYQGGTSWIAGSVGVSTSGTAVTQAEQPAAAEESFIAGTNGTSGTNGMYVNGDVAVNTPETSEYGYSMKLSAEEMDNLSTAEGLLKMDLSDESGITYLDIGSLRDTWVDWENDTVYSLFDGTWPTLDGVTVPMYDQVTNGRVRRSLILCTVNGERGYLVVLFDAAGKTGTVSGFSIGYENNGLPARGVTPLKPGDVIVPIYKSESFTSTGERVAWSEIAGDSIVWSDDKKVTYEKLDADGKYLFAFVLKDIYGGSTTCDPIAIK